MARRVYLSPSALSTFRDCPRCFWLEKRLKLKRPRGLFPSLPGGFDRVLKTYYDGYRQTSTLPPELVGQVAGVLFPHLEDLKRWRDWKQTPLGYEDRSVNASLSGALDECVVEDGQYAPLDFKTHGDVWAERPDHYYRDQLGCYSLMLYGRGYPVRPYAWIACYYPQEVATTTPGFVAMPCQVFKVDISLKAAVALVREAAMCVQHDVMPKAGRQCDYCRFVEERGAVVEPEPVVEFDPSLEPTGSPTPTGAGRG